jgi:hypothetical protein
MPLHRHLARQLRKLGVQPDAVPSAEQWAAFLDGVSRSPYDDGDRDRYSWSARSPSPHWRCRS